MLKLFEAIAQESLAPAEETLLPRLAKPFFTSSSAPRPRFNAPLTSDP